MTRRLLPTVLLGVLITLLTPLRASAHNTLLSSTPSDGASLELAPDQLQLLFDASVPLETLSVEFIDATGVRSDLVDFTYGAAGDNEVLVALPALPAGEISLRWRLVGPDGHPITGRIGFSILAAEGESPNPATTTTLVDTPVSPSAGSTSEGFSEPWATPSWLRWTLRYASYVALLAIGGILVTWAFVWPGAWKIAVVQRALRIALGVVAAGSVAQLAVVASDIGGSAPWASSGELAAAMETDAGRAFLLRTAITCGLAGVLLIPSRMTDRARQASSGALTVVLLGTWAFAGHSRSMRLPAMGVPLDVVHHAAAAAWVGGLSLVGLVAVRRLDGPELIPVMRRFAAVAAVSVAVIVGTGALQAVRLVGNPLDLLAVDHGQYLLVKLAVLALMLKVADVNRRRVALRFQSVTTVTPLVVSNLRRAMITELVSGMAVIGVTAAMVVSPPASASAGESTTAIGDGAGERSITTEGGSAAAAFVASPITTTAASPTTAATRACVLSGPDLVFGDEGSDIECLQIAPIAREYVLDPTNRFDEATSAALTARQRDLASRAGGVVGPATGEATLIWPET